MEPGEPSDPSKPTEDIWGHLLQAASQREIIPEKHLVVVGMLDRKLQPLVNFAFDSNAVMVFNVVQESQIVASHRCWRICKV
jgi:hypothetical protein